MWDKESIYKTIAYNVREQRRRLHLTQALLAEKADLSLDTVKGIESGRRSMSLGTYLRLVDALGLTPSELLGTDPPKEFVERLVFMIGGRSENEIRFLLHIVEQTLEAEELYLKGQ